MINMFFLWLLGVCFRCLHRRSRIDGVLLRWVHGEPTVTTYCEEHEATVAFFQSLKKL